MMKKYSYITLATACFLTLISCGKKADKGAAIAYVNNEPVFQSELIFLERYTRFEYSYLGSQVHGTMDLLNKIVEKKIILQEAKKTGIKISEKELDNYLKKISESFFTDKFKESLKERLIEYTDWKKYMSDQALVEKTVEAQLADLKIEPGEVKKYYYGHIQEFSHDEQVRAYQILVKTKSEIQEVKKRLEGGEDFEKVAKLKSMSPESEKGGDLGYFSREQMPPEISEAVFKLSSGKMSEPVQTNYGYHIFKVADKRKRGSALISEVETEIIEKIKAEKKEVFFKNWIKELAKNSDVKLSKDLSGGLK
ncbi:MAG: hypothetical protein A2452_06200 [Candidatus Firestonebacteria bacterium RIFOXYC2_FULL_39_67]|nr:MAG: hypothetical protein A2536_00835 [Candidatus Firestonebacteria bacterium RIFOXYD2_FULL_39_29]OGF53814.1 MAG: hypothetical protein A2452_06200 [Candidatus Firestonebacteria bacterium RIFOXYC2_FULL_39_67]